MHYSVTQIIRADIFRINMQAMGLLTDTENWRLRMRQECRERFPRHRGLAIPTCITARAWPTSRDSCRDRQLAVSFEVSGMGNVPDIPGACASRNFAYLARGPWNPKYSLSHSRYIDKI